MLLGERQRVQGSTRIQDRMTPTRFGAKSCPAGGGDTPTEDAPDWPDQRIAGGFDEASACRIPMYWRPCAMLEKKTVPRRGLAATIGDPLNRFGWLSIWFANSPKTEEFTELVASTSDLKRLDRFVDAVAIAQSLIKRRIELARKRLADGSEVRIWYQSWPVDAGPSAHADARHLYGIRGGVPRPDVVIQRVSSLGQPMDAVILELKATKSAMYLSEGLSQLLGYLKDCPTLFSTQPSGWLVAPDSDAFESRKAEGATLWAVGVDAVAKAAIERFAGARHESLA